MTDRTLNKAISALSRNDHRAAASLFQDAGNEIRNYDQKKELWSLADRSRKIMESD